jgi:hypothetical protein
VHSAEPGPDLAVASYARLLTAERDAVDPAARYAACCAIEQLLADLALLPGPAAADLSGPLARIRSLAVGYAAGLAGAVGPRPGPMAGLLPAVSRLRATVEAGWALLDRDGRRDFLGSPGLSPRWADCLAPYPVDFGRYLAAAGAVAAPSGPCLVLGIRTAGSYLAPLWVAALRGHGVAARHATIRPRRSLEGNLTLPDMPPDLADGWPSILLVDDAVFSGRTLARAEAEVARLAPATAQIRSAVYAIGDHSAPDSAARASRVVLPGCRRPLPVAGEADPRAYFTAALAPLGLRLAQDDDDVRPCPPSYWQSYILASVDVPSRLLDGLDHRVRKRRYRLTICSQTGERQAVIAKYLGFGPLADAEAADLRTHWYGSGVLGMAGGYLLCQWLDGEQLAFRAGARLSPAEIAVIAGGTAAATRLRSVRDAGPAEWDSRCDELARSWQGISPQVSAALTACRGQVPWSPVVAFPRNQGHWHYVRLADGGLRRLHQDVGRWPRHADPAWDLASAIVELGLDETQAGQLLAGYCDRVPDPGIRRRLGPMVAQYALSVLSDFGEHHRTVAGVPAVFRRGDPVLSEPFTGRVRAALAAAGPWLGVPDGAALTLPAPLAGG